MRADQEDKRGRLIILVVVLACAIAVLLYGVIRGCSQSADTTRPTNYGPFSDLVSGDIPNAGIFVLAAEQGPSEHAKKSELYLVVQAAEGQKPQTTADAVISLTRKYKDVLHLNSLHLIVESGDPLYEITVDLNSETTFT